jgi:hypothetical protein
MASSYLSSKRENGSPPPPSPVLEPLPVASPCPPASTEHSASVLWCPSCRQTQPGAGCGAAVGHKTRGARGTPVVPGHSPPGPVVSDEPEEPWSEPPADRATPDEPFDMPMGPPEEIPIPTMSGHGHTQACPECHCLSLVVWGVYHIVTTGPRPDKHHASAGDTCERYQRSPGFRGP